MDRVENACDKIKEKYPELVKMVQDLMKKNGDKIQENKAQLMGPKKETEDYLVIGSGVEIAKGVLENNKNKTPEERIAEAIQVCADKTLYVNNEMHIVCTKIDRKKNGGKNK